MISRDRLPTSVWTILPRPKRGSHSAPPRDDIRATPLNAFRTMSASSAVGARDGPAVSRQTSQFPQRAGSGSPKWAKTKEGQPVYYAYMNRPDSVWDSAVGSIHILAKQHSYQEKPTKLPRVGVAVI